MNTNEDSLGKYLFYKNRKTGKSEKGYLVNMSYITMLILRNNFDL